MKRFAQAWRRHPVILSAFVLATAFVVLFAFRSVAVMVYWSQPDRQNQTIQGWMTPRYIAQSWHLPPRIMTRALNADQMPHRRQSLQQIAEMQGITMDELARRITIAAEEYRDGQP